jgi:MoxR-like ATPase
MVVNHQAHFSGSGRLPTSKVKKSTVRSLGEASSMVPDMPAYATLTQFTQARTPLDTPWRLSAVRSDQTAEATDSETIQLISEITSRVDDLHAAILQRNAGNASQQVAETLGTDTQFRRRVRASIIDLQRGLLERETEVRLLLLAALCGEHLLLLGPPGTAKSELSRRLSKLTGGRYFERLLTRFSVPEELFGPLSMKGLENDLYVRQIDGYLPTAEVAFIDEIFKANSAILNALLTLLNERLFDNGAERFPVPLLCLVGASNELPESEELDALYDRFLIRRQVGQVSARGLGTLARLAAGALGKEDAVLLSTDTTLDGNGNGNGNGNGDESSTQEEDPELRMEDFRSAAADASNAVEVPDTVIDLLTDLRNYLQDKCEPPVYVSDRRFMKAVRMLQVAAYADGRGAVTESDCLLLEFVFGQRPDDAHKVKARVLEIISSDPGLQQAELVLLGLFGRMCRLLDTSNDRDLDQVEVDVKETVQEAESLVELLDLRQGGLAATLDFDFPELRSSLWLSEAGAAAAAQVLAPQTSENRRKSEDLLREALILREAIVRKVPSTVLERLLPKRFKQYQKGVAGRV